MDSSSISDKINHGELFNEEFQKIFEQILTSYSLFQEQLTSITSTELPAENAASKTKVRPSLALNISLCVYYPLFADCPGVKREIPLCADDFTFETKNLESKSSPKTGRRAKRP